MAKYAVIPNRDVEAIIQQPAKEKARLQAKVQVKIASKTSLNAYGT